MNTNELDVRVIWAILRRQLVWILVMAVLGAFVAFMVANYMLPKKYTSSIQVLITNREERQSVNDLTMSKSMASTYCVLLTSPAAQTRLIDKLTEIRYPDAVADKQGELQPGEKLTGEELEALREEVKSKAETDVNGSSITSKVVNSTEIVELTVVNPDSNIAALLCATLAQVAKDWIPEIYGPDSSSTALKEQVDPSSAPSSPKLSIAILLGAVVGILLVCGSALLVYMSDNRVKDEIDFAAKVGIPVLGAVPNMDETRERKESGYYENNDSQKKNK